MLKVELNEKIEILFAGHWVTNPGWQILDQVHDYSN